MPSFIITKIHKKHREKVPTATRNLDKSRIYCNVQQENSISKHSANSSKNNTKVSKTHFNVVKRKTIYNPANVPVGTRTEPGQNKDETKVKVSGNSRKKIETSYTTLKKIADEAIAKNKIFTMYGNSNAIRDALRKRGWVEKIPQDQMSSTKIKNALILKNYIPKELETLVLSYMVEKHSAYFIWHANENNINNVIKCNAIQNKLASKPIWTTKEGLCSILKQNYWHNIPNVSELSVPRSYNNTEPAEVKAFEEDYKITACTNLLKWVLNMVSNDKQIFLTSGKITMNVIIFALKRCKEYIFKQQNVDIDQICINTTTETEQWNIFLNKCNLLIGEQEVFKEDRYNKLSFYLGYSKYLLEKLYIYRPQLRCEGYLNIWIIKPARNSRGRGIRMASKVESISKILKKNTHRCVIQKYIEEPLLIHDTKFDIRQYYLVTNFNPLVIWMYKDCYLKFSSQKYNLMDYHESIHLTNNAVQKKYTNCKPRHPELPDCNMWDLDTFKKYLRSVGDNHVWDKIIYPGMKKAIINVMLTSQIDTTASRKRFAFHGCDFVLDRGYNPWLIEVNGGPDLKATTPVTAKICPAVLADIIKVVIDYRQNRNASTGNFECVYRQPWTMPRYGSLPDLLVQGYAVPRNYFYTGSVKIQNSDFHITKANSPHEWNNHPKFHKSYDPSEEISALGNNTNPAISLDNNANNCITSLYCRIPKNKISFTSEEKPSTQFLQNMLQNNQLKQPVQWPKLNFQNNKYHVIYQNYNMEEDSNYFKKEIRKKLIRLSDTKLKTNTITEALSDMNNFIRKKETEYLSTTTF